MNLLSYFRKRNIKSIYKLEKGDLYLSTEPYKIEKTRDEGEKDIYNLLKTGKREGCWIYSYDESMWYNLTKGHYFGKNLSGVVIRNYKYINYGKNTSIYHFHPLVMQNHLCDLAGKHDSWRVIYGRKYKNASALFCSLPSTQDMIFSIKLKREFSGDFINFNIVS